MTPERKQLFSFTGWIIPHLHTIVFFVGNVATWNHVQSHGFTHKDKCYFIQEEGKTLGSAHYLQDDSKCLWIEAIVMVIHSRVYVAKVRSCFWERIEGMYLQIGSRFTAERNTVYFGCAEKGFNNIKGIVRNESSVITLMPFQTGMIFFCGTQKMNVWRTS